MVVLDGMRTPVMSRSVMFDELRASKRAKHVAAAQELTHGYELPVQDQRPVICDAGEETYSEIEIKHVPEPPRPQRKFLTLFMAT